MAKKNIQSLYYDWKDSPSLSDFKALLKPFGIHVYESPEMDGSDMYGFIFSDKTLTKKEIEEYEAKELGIPTEEDPE